MGRSGNRGDSLRGKCDPDELRAAPRDPRLEKRERAIVIPCSHPEAHAVGVEADERDEHEIEPAGGNRARRRGLENPEPVGAHRTLGRNEEHAPAAAIDDAWQVDESASPAGEPRKGRDIELLGERRIQGDALAGMKPEAALNVERHANLGLPAGLARYGSPPRSELPTQRPASPREFVIPLRPHYHLLNYIYGVAPRATPLNPGRSP